MKQTKIYFNGLRYPESTNNPLFIATCTQETQAMIHPQFLKNTAFLLTLLSAFPAFAATQGTLGSTSTGTVNLSITKSVQAQISDLSDMTLANWSVGDGAVTLFSNACIYSSTGSYKVTATGSGLANAFTISSGLNTIPYTVTWNAGGQGNLANTGTSLTSNIQSTNFANANTTNATCSGGGAGNDTARVVVGITQANMNSAASSSTPYTGTLTMLITPF
jgi:hypothetical protein